MSNPLVSIAALILLLGCEARPQPTAPVVVDRTPTFIHAPGIAGELDIDRALLRGLKAGGLKGDVEIFNWTGDQPGVDALHARNKNDAAAQRLADKIVAVRKARPEGPIFLSGHSGGTGIIVWALEKLPADVQVDRVLLLAPALSTTYDLSHALNHVSGQAYAFTSPNDYFVLNWGTRLFATIDGKNEKAAGSVGFEQPAAADPNAYRKLVQMPYKNEWMKYENIGDHIGAMSEPFAREVLAPLLTEGYDSERSAALSR